MSLKIGAALYSAVLRQAELAYPNECCGILLGVRESGSRNVCELRLTANVHTSSHQTRFEVDPLELLAIEQQSQAGGLAMVGCYHSHPDAMAIPSDYDIECAWPELSYVIVSVIQGRAVNCYSFEVTETGNAMIPELIQIERA